MAACTSTLHLDRDLSDERSVWPAAPIRLTLSAPMPDDDSQPRNPLHGVTLERVLRDLVDYFGWDELGEQVQIRCFTHDPSIASSLRFLRKTPWAREKVESLYLFMLREQARRARP